MSHSAQALLRNAAAPDMRPSQMRAVASGPLQSHVLRRTGSVNTHPVQARGVARLDSEQLRSNSVNLSRMRPHTLPSGKSQGCESEHDDSWHLGPQPKWLHE